MGQFIPDAPSGSPRTPVISPQTVPAGKFAPESLTASSVAAQAPPPAPPPTPEPQFRQDINRALGQVRSDIDYVAGPAGMLIPIPGSIGETGSMAGGIAGSLASRHPIVSPALGILGAMTGAYGAERLTGGKEPGLEAGRAGVGQTIAEAAIGALRQPWYALAANRALKARTGQIEAGKEQFKTDVADYRQQVAQDKALRQRALEASERQQEQRKYATELQHQQQKQAQQAAYQQAVAQRQAEYEQAVRQRQMAAGVNAETGAAVIADHYKNVVPAWRDLPSGTKGLADMTFGKGQKLLSEEYERSVSSVIEKARGQQVQIPIEAAMRLNLPVDERTAYLQAAKMGIKLPPGMAPGDPGMTMVDAEALFRAAQGKWQKEPGAYRAAFNALDAAGIGDPAARGAYRAGQGLIEFTARSKMIRPAGPEGPERFDPQKAVNALTDLATINQLRRREMGDIFSGPIPEASRAALPPPMPVEPAPIPKPTIPPVPQPAPLPQRQPPTKPVEPPMPAGVKQVEILPSLAGHPWLLGAGLSGGAHFMGLPGGLGYGLAATIPGRRLTTQAPVNPRLDALLRTIPGLYGAPAVQEINRRAQEKREKK